MNRFSKVLIVGCIFLRISTTQATEAEVDELYRAASTGACGTVARLMHLEDALFARKGLSLLHIAAVKDRVQLVKFLCSQNNCDINCKSSPRYKHITPLYLASSCGNVRVVEILLKAGAHVNIVSDQGASAFLVAAQAGHADVVRLLLHVGADTTRTYAAGGTALMCACQNGHLAVVVALKNYFDVNQSRPDGCIALHFAALNGHTAIVQFLVHIGACLSSANHKGATPLHMAAGNGHAETVRFIINVNQVGFGIDFSDHEGITPLMFAAVYGHLESVRILMEAGADAKKTNIRGVNSLHAAAEGGHAEVVHYILEQDRELDVNSTGQAGANALYLAAQHGYLDVVKMLIKAGIDATKRANNGLTPLDVARMFSHAEVVAYLEEVIEEPVCQVM